MSGLNLFDHFEEEDEPIVSNKHQSPKSEIRHEEKTSSISVSKFDSSSKRKMDEESENDNRKLQKKFSAMDILDNIDVSLLQNRVIITTVETIEACTHEVASPPDYKYEPLKISTGDPARNYPFILDPFQKEAILCIENNQSVLVSAHTSAGKTVVAEYAIARSLSNNQRVIYTTPIKALSNQKYREFSEEFGDVGLVTGDVTINPNASCLIMTTEILRNMLYRGSEITREVGWVVFDEIHYMRDKQRGVVWEETLILLPDNVHYVFLSATIPNARQFAEWVCHLHHQPCHVVYTDYRPTPLQHFIFPAGGDGIHLVVDEKGQFKEDNFNAAMSVLQSGDAAKGDSQRGRHGGMKKNANDTCVFQVVKMIMERNFAPVIVFSFSKKDCELYAMQMTKLDFNTVEEKKLVDEVFNNAMDVLSEEDKRIPQVENVLPFLRRGIGIHHGGLLPILKETIEIMFGEGLIKALFATETFAMGLNMPARTVLFTGMRKFDGKNYRWLTSGEYIQMSGRAGRRGLDESGIVILMIDEKVSPSVGKDMVQGKPDPINSEFHLTYNMVLNLLRVEEINPEYMMERSFFQFQNQAAIPDLYSRYEDKFKEYHNLHIEDEVKIKSYHTILKTVNKLSIEHRNFITKPQYLIPFLHPGRLVKVKQFNEEFDWGVIVNHKKSVEFKSGTRKNKNDSPDTVVIVDILLHIKPNSKQEDESLKPCPPGDAGDVEVVPVLSKLITHISSVRVHLPSDLRPLDARRSVLKVLQQVKKRFSDGPPLLNPVTDMQISEPDFLKINEDMNKFQKRLKEHPLHGNLKINEMLEEYEKKFNCGLEMERLASELKKAKSLLQMDELKNRKKVLRRLGYCDETDVIQLKGRIACELSSADELLITEMIFNGIFDNLDPSLSVSLLSCFVCDEKSQQMPARAEELSGPLRKMQDLARRIAKVSKDSKLNIEEDEYVEQFKPFLMDVVYAWCNGSSFVQLCKMTDVFEGSIIRCMRRLEELLRQLCQAAKSIGNVDLENKFSEGIRLIKRDIVFAASLYL